MSVWKTSRAKPGTTPVRIPEPFAPIPHLCYTGLRDLTGSVIPGQRTHTEAAMDSHARDNLKQKKLFLFDIDGTLAVGDTLYEGSAELLDHIRSIGGKAY